MSDNQEPDRSFDEMEFTRKKAVHAVVSFALSALVVAVLVGVVFFLVSRRPAVDAARPEPLIPVVDVLQVREEDHALEIETQGVVESMQEVTLSAEVGGRVTFVAPHLLQGGAVEKGDLLVEIERADYVAAVTRARANLDEAELLLAQEEARREQAIRDWKKLGRGEPNDLVLREPHIKAATARRDSAAEEVQRAARDLERTAIMAPFSGVVGQKSVEFGAVLAPGSVVARVYSTDKLEIRLPVSLEDFGALARDDEGAVVGAVTLSGLIGTEKFHWPGVVVRTDGRIDSATLSATVIVRIEPAEENPPYLSHPPVGMFLAADIPGRVVTGAVEVPRRALREGNRVLVVDAGNRVRERRVTVIRTLRKTALVSKGLKDGDDVVVTRMNGTVEEMEVELKTRFREISEVLEAEDEEDEEGEKGEEEGGRLNAEERRP